MGLIELMEHERRVRFYCNVVKIISFGILCYIFVHFVVKFW